MAQHCLAVPGDSEAVKCEYKKGIWLDHRFISSSKTHELNFFPDKMLKNLMLEKNQQIK